jgi:hypothetical protein
LNILLIHRYNQLNFISNDSKIKKFISTPGELYDFSGYELGRPANRITVGKILRSLEEPIVLNKAITAIKISSQPMETPPKTSPVVGRVTGKAWVKRPKMIFASWSRIMLIPKVASNGTILVFF